MGRTRLTAQPTIGSVLGGNLGQINYQARLFTSNLRGEEVRMLNTVQGAAFTLDNERDWAWELGVDMLYTEDFDPARDYVKLCVDVKVGASWERYDMGLYRFYEAQMDVLEKRRQWHLTGYSGEKFLAMKMAKRPSPWPQIVGYHVPPGTGILAECGRILKAEMGVPDQMLQFPWTEEKYLARGLIFDVAQDQQGTYWLPIVHSLLDAGAFTRVKQDKHGRWFTRPKQSLRLLPLSVSYGPATLARGIDDLVNADEVIQLNRDFSEFGNEIVVVSSDTRQIPPICAVVTDKDPSHPYSTINYETITRVVELQQLIAQPEAIALAREELARRTQIPDSYNFSTPFDPRMDVMGVTGAHYRDSAGDPLFVGKYWQQAVAATVQPLSNMSHDVGTLDPTEPEADLG